LASSNEKFLCFALTENIFGFIFCKSQRRKMKKRIVEALFEKGAAAELLPTFFFSPSPGEERDAILSFGE
jgi:hypothetical protein